MEPPAPVLAAALDLPEQSLMSRPGEAATDGWLVANTLGDYRILAEIGRGGMGVVYEAEQISLGRRVALKVLSYASILDKTKLERFKNEARAAASLDHPNVVHVHAVGTHRGVHYCAMQLIDGQTVEALIREERRRRGLEAAPGPIPFLAGRSDEDHTVSQESRRANGRPSMIRASTMAPRWRAWPALRSGGEFEEWWNWRSRRRKHWSTLTKWALFIETLSRPIC